MRLVVVGGVAAGTKAASRARRVDPDLEVTIYQEEPDTSISECGLPYILSDYVEERESLVARTPEEFAGQGIETFVLHRVEKVDPAGKTLSVRNLATNETFEDAYDRLILATGASAVMPPIPGADLDGVFNLRFLTDSDAILDYVAEHSPERAVVVGGGYIGLEVAENLVRAGMEVSLVEGEDRVAATYGPEVSARIEEHLRERGVSVYTGAAVEEVLGGNGRVRAVEVGGKEVSADLAVVAVGIEPAVGLARDAGVEIGESGAIRVNRRMETSLPDVWAAGDCVETVNLASGAADWVPLGDTANQMGRVAGTNAASPSGDSPLEFPGVLGTGVFKVFDLGVARTGLSEAEAQEQGFEAVSAEIEANTRAGYFPGSEPVYLKVIADGETGRILGAETVGGNADKMVDICATAIWGRLAVPDLVDLDLAYAPPFGPALSPVIQAGTVLSGALGRRVEGARATE